MNICPFVKNENNRCLCIASTKSKAFPTEDKLKDFCFSENHDECSVMLVGALIGSRGIKKFMRERSYCRQEMI